MASTAVDFGRIELRRGASIELRLGVDLLIVGRFRLRMARGRFSAETRFLCRGALVTGLFCSVFDSLPLASLSSTSTFAIFLTLSIGFAASAK